MLLEIEQGVPTDKGSSKTASNAKKIAIYVMAPALIAGVFSIAPKFYEELTKPKAVLEYEINTGPPMITGPQFQKIFSISVKNPGRIGITDIDFLISASFGSFQAFALDANLIRHDLKEEGALRHVTIPRLLPGETINVSAIIASSGRQPEVEVKLRSAEILGQARSSASAPPNHIQAVQFFSAVVSSAAGIIVFSIFYMTYRRKSRKLSTNSTDLENFLAINMFSRVLKGNDIGREEVINLILSLSGLSINDSLAYLRDYTFREFADVLLGMGVNGCREDKNKIGVCLTALLVAPINQQSFEIVISHLDYLGFPVQNLEIEKFKNLPNKDAKTTRIRIIKIFEQKKIGMMNNN